MWESLIRFSGKKDATHCGQKPLKTIATKPLSKYRQNLTFIKYFKPNTVKIVQLKGNNFCWWRIWIADLCGQSYKHFTLINYNFRVVIYEHKKFIRLATGVRSSCLTNCATTTAQTLQFLNCQTPFLGSDHSVNCSTAIAQYQPDNYIRPNSIKIKCVTGSVTSWRNKK